MASALDKAKALLKAPGVSASLIGHLGKLIPAWGNFIGGATAAGYTADEIVDFLRNQMSTPEEKREKAQLQQRAESNQATPSERVSLNMREQREGTMNTAQNAIGLASRGAGALGALHQAGQAQEQQAQQQQEALQAQQAEQQANRAQKQSQFEQKLAHQKEMQAERLAGRAEKATSKEVALSKKDLESMDAIVKASLPKLGADDTRGVLRTLFYPKATEAYERARGPLEELEKKLKPGKNTAKAVKNPRIIAEQLDLFEPPKDAAVGVDPVVQALEAISARMRKGV